MNLDVPTIILLTIVNTTVMGAGLLVITRGSPGLVRGVALWGKATLIQALGWVIVGALRGVIPDVLSIVAGNGLILLAFAWYLIIIADFVGTRIRATRVHAIVGIEVALLLYFSVVDPNLTARNVIISVCMSILTLGSAMLLFAGRPARQWGHFFTAGIFGLCGVFMASRAFYYLAYNPDPGQVAFSRNGINGTSYLVFHILVVLLCFGFTLMCSDRNASQARKAEKASLEDKNFAKSIAENTPGMVGYWTRDLRCSFANQEYVDWFGRTPEQILGTRLQDLLGPAVFLTNLPYIQGALAGEKQQFERTLTKPNGEVGDTLARYIPHLINHQVAGFFVFVTDISEIKTAYNSLRKSEARNQAMIKAIPDLVFTHDRNGECLSVHTSDPRQLDMAPEQVLHRRITDILPQPAARVFAEAISAAFVSGLQEVRYRLPMPDGQEHVYEARVVPSDADTVLSLVRDITDQERDRRNSEEYAALLSSRLELNEADLQENEKMLALAGDAAGLGMWTYDVLRDEFLVSRQCRTILYFSPDQSINMATFTSNIVPEDRPPFVENLEVADAHDAYYENSYRIMLPDETIRWITTRARIEFGADGKARRIRGASVDITQRKQAEIETEQRQLEHTYLSRLASLGELSGAMAHELNQPLMSILANAEAAQLYLAQSGDRHPELDEILQDIVDEDIRAGEVIHSLRKMFGRQEMVVKAHDINALLLDVARLVRNELVRQEVSVQTELASGLPSVNVDGVQIKQVLINLITNACDSMNSDKTLNRTVILRTAWDEDDHLRVSVIDHGPGIGDTGSEKMFSPFYTTKEGGMGLGLSICRNIIVANGGRLWAANGIDGGASFQFALPIMTAKNT